MNVSPVLRTHRNFAYNGLTIRVYSGDPSHLSWLEEFLSPQFQLLDEGASECTVSLTANNQLFREVFRRGARPDGGRVDCFALDSHLVRLPLWQSVGPDQIIFDPQFRVFYVVNPDGAGTEMLTRANNLSARISLMRVTREFAMNHLHRAGCLIIHGSAFVVGDRGVIIAGPKRAGKTTLLIHALRGGAVAYLSNDRVVASFDGTAPMLRGMPTVVTVRRQTLEMFPSLLDRLVARSYRSRLSLGEIREAQLRPVQPDQDGNYYLSPAQFCDLLQVASVAQAQAEALVFPQVTGRSGTIELERLSSKAAAVRLADCLFSSHSMQKVSAVFALSGSGAIPDRAMLEDLCLRLTSQVRCFECRLGDDAYRSAGSAARLIHDVVG
ncbi:MAG: hypothetical protein ACREJ6_15715 [Candidatus Methylomirabilis sp.]